MTSIILEKGSSGSETQVEKSINIIMDLDNPLDIRVNASEKLREELPGTYKENPELFSESCESILEICLDPEVENDEVKENIFCALGDSMAPAVAQEYPQIWEVSLQLFESSSERGYLKKMANRYVGCMLFGQDPIELENSRARAKYYKKLMKRVNRLNRNDPADKKILSKKLHKYINPELLEESEALFELGFVAVCDRLGHEYRQLERRYRSDSSFDDESAIEGREIADGIVILLDVLKNCMSEDLQKKRPDLFKRGVGRLARMSSYQMGIFSEGPGSGGSIPFEFKRVTHKAINTGLNVTLSTEKAREAFKTNTA